MALSEKLQKRRNEMNLTQEEVALKIHVSRQTISNWETGRTLPDINSLILISELYDLSLDVILKEDTTMTNHFQKITDNNKFLKLFCYLLIVNILLIVSAMFVKSTLLTTLLLILIAITSLSIIVLTIKKV